MVMRSARLRERRLERRLAVGGRVRLVARGQGCPTVVGTLVDVSAGGLRLSSPAHPILPAGVTVEVAIDLEDGIHPEHAGGMHLIGEAEVLRVQGDDLAGSIQTALRFTRSLRMREPLDGVFLL
jgi:hypothetical protein